MSTQWITHKFGGTSLADVDAFGAVRDILATPTDSRQAVVVSAVAGVTDDLIDLVGMAGSRDTGYEDKTRRIRESQATLIDQLVPGDVGGALLAQVDDDIEEIGGLLKASWVMRTSVSTTDAVAGYGELWSARLLAAFLAESGMDVTWMDAREVLVVNPAELVSAVDWETSGTNLDRWLSDCDSDILVITGFIASDSQGSPITLGRNGSDYSASIFAALLSSVEISIWTDVDGVLSADPRLVPDAKVLEELSYNEAMELAYFGAEVLHPATMTPAVTEEIPIYIRNTFNPSGSGTRIHVQSRTDSPVKGFASISAVALLNLEGSAMVGVPGISERLFGGLRRAGVSVVMISQGSSEHSICFAIPQDQALLASSTIETVFETERTRGIQTLEVTESCTILAVVGDTMSGTPGVAAGFFGALARAGVNVRAIAQGSSERNISVVIDEADAAKALRAAHAGFYLSKQTLSIGLIGPGHVGSAFLDQLAARSEWLLEEFGVDLRVRAICATKKMIVDQAPIELSSWRERLDKEAIPADLDELAAHVHTESVPHAVIIDCTASENVGSRYLDWLSGGIHVITPNKKANTGTLDYYRSLREHGRRADAHYLYETTVGAALPILQTLRDLVQTGDEIRRIEGILSGTLSYLFNSFDGTKPFSEIVRQAWEKGYTEPDPREDLSGLDVGRKVVILAREIGMDLDLSDLEIDGLVPEGLEDGSVNNFLDRLENHDDEMADLVEDAKSRGEVLRFVGSITAEEGCSVALRSYPTDHPFARIHLTDNIVQFQTARYNDNPLVVQGPGAGPEVTAGGVFADLLRLASNLGATL
ncbi:MAG: bifunctional aspartate kinase/homoserine dehydrogenase I [Acidimicrobiia bacterium]